MFYVTLLVVTCARTLLISMVVFSKSYNEKCTENEVKILKIKADLGLYHPHHLKLSRHELDYVLQISQQHRKPVNLK